MAYVSNSRKPLKIQGKDGKIRLVAIGEHIPEVDTWKDNIKHFNLTRGIIKEVDVAPPAKVAATPVPAAVKVAVKAPAKHGDDDLFADTKGGAPKGK